MEWAIMFNSELLIQLIQNAQEHGILNQFAQECGIDSGILSRIINNKSKQVPSRKP